MFCALAVSQKGATLNNTYRQLMSTFAEVRATIDSLPEEDRLGILTHLPHTLPDPPLGASDEEVLQREADMDSGQVTPISHEEFVAHVRSESK